MPRSLTEFREQYPAFRFFEDSNYSFCVLAPFAQGKHLPQVLLNEAQVILGIDTILDKIYIFKDSRVVLNDPDSVTRLFQVITGLVPDSILGPETVKMLCHLRRMHQHVTFKPGPPAWARLNTELGFTF